MAEPRDRFPYPFQSRQLTHASPVQQTSHARRRLREPDRRFADVPIFFRRRLRQRLALRPSGRPGRRRRRARVHGSRRGHPRGSDFAPRPRRLERKAFRAARADRAIHRNSRCARWHPARARRTQGQHVSAGGRKRRRPGSIRRVAPVAPSAIAFNDSFPMPAELTVDQIHALQGAFAVAAERAFAAGFRVIEIHAAHGYLIHEFLSPFSNRRVDAYGGSFDNRTRFVRECVVAVRRTLPERCPLFVRISATDWTEGGWDIDQSVELARKLLALGVDVIDCSSGGNVEKARDSGRAGLSNAVRRADSSRGEYRDRSGRHDHRAGPSRPDHPQRTGRPRPAGAPDVARPLLAAARRARTRSGRAVAEAIPGAAPSGTPERAPAPGDRITEPVGS